MRFKPSFGQSGKGRTSGIVLAGAGLTLAFSIIIGTMIGYGIDLWLHTRGFVIAFTLVGVVAGFKELFQAVRDANKDDEDENRRRGRS